MKIKSDFVLRQVAGTSVVVPVGSEALDFNGMINLNETGTFLFKLLEQDTSKENLVSELLKEYDVSEEKASSDVDVFINKLKDADILE